MHIMELAELVNEGIYMELAELVNEGIYIYTSWS